MAGALSFNSATMRAARAWAEDRGREEGEARRRREREQAAALAGPVSPFGEDAAGGFLGAQRADAAEV